MKIITRPILFIGKFRLLRGREVLLGSVCSPTIEPVGYHVGAARRCHEVPISKTRRSERGARS